MRFTRIEDLEVRYRRDFLRGVMYLATQKPKAVGQRLTLLLADPRGAEIVSLSGEVTQVLDPAAAAARGAQPGMGIRLLDAAGDKLQIIENLIRKVRGISSPPVAAPVATPSPGPAVLVPPAPLITT